MGRDPWDGEVWQPVTLHKYLYVGGDPINWWDPTGWDEEEDVQLTGEVSEGAVEGEEALAKEISCVFDTAADLLQVTVSGDAADLVSLVIDAANCTVKGKKAKIPPDKGPPNGYIQGPRQGRKYGPNGEPFRDYDYPHQGANYNHTHDWPGGRRQHPGTPWPPGVPFPPENP
jgi:hypothetical protein